MFHYHSTKQTLGERTLQLYEATFSARAAKGTHHTYDTQLLHYTYTINGEDGYTSATTFVHSNFPAFVHLLGTDPRAKRNGLRASTKRYITIRRISHQVVM